MKKLILICLGLLSFELRAFDFQEADSLFEKREQDTSSILRSRMLYEQALPSVSGHEYFYAVEQILRLDVYDALRIPDLKKTERQAPLERCLKAAEKLNPGQLKAENPHYYYWRTICTSYLVELLGTYEVFRKATQLFESAEKGLKIDDSYEGGGFHRILGCLYLKIPSINPVGRAGNVHKAIEHFEKSLNSGAYRDSPHPETDQGDYHFSTHYYYASALLEAGRKSEAKGIVDSTIERIESEDLPKGREPEARLALKWMVELRAKII